MTAPSERESGQRIALTFRQVAAILGPYTWHALREQLITVVPVCAYLVLFQLVILQRGITNVVSITGGVVLVIVGLMFFLEGVKISLVPVGETIGDVLPERSTMFVLLLFSFLLGIVGAFGEPVIGSLQIAGAGVNPATAPLLYEILVRNPLFLSLFISLGVGIAVTLSTIRTLYAWSIKPLILPVVGVCVLATLLASRDPRLATAIGLAWDSGAVIVGPVLCPLVLSLGLGIYRATGRSDTGVAGFGIAGLISVMPIVMIVLLTFAMSLWVGETSGDVVAADHGAPAQSLSVVGALVGAVRAIAPVYVFLWLFLRYYLKETGIPGRQYLLGIGFAIGGLFFFNYGISIGLAELGEQVGRQLPTAFHPPGSSTFSTEVGKIVVVFFGVVLGYGATLAEPAFNILGRQVEDVTEGAFKKRVFGQAVAIGVGVGAGLGIVSTVYHVDLLHLLLPPYAILFVLTILSREKYAAIAWDGGSVTTGPVTVPLKISIGIALSHVTGFAEGFGIIALASAYPVMNILLLGLYTDYRERKMLRTTGDRR